MHKKIGPLAIALTLSGCFLGDRITPSAEAEASYVAGALCITTPGRTEKQKLKSIHIEKWGEPPGFTKHFDNAGEYRVIRKDTCMPLFGYKFESGLAYHISIRFTQDPEREQTDFYTDYYTVSFIIWESSDKVKHISYQ